MGSSSPTRASPCASSADDDAGCWSGGHGGGPNLGRARRCARSPCLPTRLRNSTPSEAGGAEPVGYGGCRTRPLRRVRAPDPGHRGRAAAGRRGRTGPGGGPAGRTARARPGRGPPLRRSGADRRGRHRGPDADGFTVALADGGVGPRASTAGDHGPGRRAARRAGTAGSVGTGCGAGRTATAGRPVTRRWRSPRTASWECG